MSVPDPRWVFDTNAIISAMLSKDSTPGRAFYAAVACGTVLLSAPVLDELKEVVLRKKFDRYVTVDDREQFLLTLIETAWIVDPTEAVRACRDAQDDKLLELAIAGQASCLVSGDPDLLVLHPFRDIPILTPAPFLDWLPMRRPAGDSPVS